MPDSPSGVYTLPPSYKVANGDLTDASQHNPPFEDVQQALTNRVHRDGRTSMTGPLRLANGTQTLPGLAFALAPGTGFYRDETGVLSLSINGAKVLSITDNGIAYATTPAPFIKEHEDTTGTVVFDYADSAIHKATMTDNFTIEVANIPDGGDLQVNLAKSGSTGTLTVTGVDRWVLGVDEPNSDITTTGLDPANLPDGSTHMFVFSCVGSDIVGFVARVE